MPMPAGRSGLPPDIEQRIRARGAALDMALTHEIYRPLLALQPRGAIRVQRDITYGHDVRHRLDIYHPEGEHTAPCKILVFLHGGGFIRGDKADRENAGFYFAGQGFVVIVPNYRLGPTHRWPAGGEDVVAVYQWIQANADLLGGTVGEIFLAGESAGAAHVATAVLLRRLQPQAGMKLAGVVLISGVYNVQLEKLARDQLGIATPDPRNEAYFGSDFETYPLQSIVDLVDAPPVPLLITFAELDLVQMQIQAGELFARLTTAHGFHPEIYVVSGHNHLTQGYSINTGDDSLSGPMIDFMRARLNES